MNRQDYILNICHIVCKCPLEYGYPIGQRLYGGHIWPYRVEGVNGLSIIR